MKIVLLVLLILILLLLTAGYILFYIGCVRIKKKPDPALAGFLRPYLDEIRDGIQWYKERTTERVEIASFDGLRLVGWFLPAKDARGTLLLVHGYRSDHICDFGAVFRDFHGMGWNILAVDQRAHGESDGKYICFGVKERYDVRDWATYLFDRFGPEHPVVLDGVSMGCSSVLMSLNTGLPENVRGAIADCGYTTPYDEFVYLFRSHGKIPVPVHPLMDIGEGFAQIFARFGFRDASTLKSLEESTLPVLFVHGGKDRLVPPVFSRQNYEACRGEKNLVIVPEASHGTSYLADKAGCQAALADFLDRCAAPKNVM